MNETIINRTVSQDFERNTLVEVEVLAYMKLVCAAMGMILNIVTLGISAFIGYSTRPYVWNILSLTVTDLIMSSGILLYALLEEINTSNLTLINCLKFVVKCFESASILACLCMLLFIAVDQCIGVALPLRYHQILTKKVSKCLILGVWLFNVFVMFVSVVSNTVLEGGINSDNNIKTCFNLRRLYTMYANAILITASCPIFLGLYIVIYKNIRALKRRDSQRGRRVSMRKATVTTLILVVPFVLIYVPVSIYVLAISFYELEVTWLFWESFMVLLAVHTVWDPICYAIRVKEIQRGYKQLCCKI